MSVQVPWNAWFGEETMELAMPATWDVDLFHMRSPELAPATVEERIRRPLGGTSLRELARGKQRVAIAVDDISRPTPAHVVLPLLLEELTAAGATDDSIEVFIASGAHRAPLYREVTMKIGEQFASRLKINYHNPFDNLANLGRTSNGIPMLVNRSFVACDLRLSIGGITPHDFAGFGGGYKTITVGLSGIQPLYDTHVKRIAEFSAAVGRLEGNRFQSYIREIGERVGVHFAVNVVMTERRGVADLYAGDPQQAFDCACAAARTLYATPCNGGYDVVVLNAYPKDLDMTQSMMALNVSFFNNESIVRDGGTVVLTTSAIDGAAIHYLGGEGCAGFVPPTEECMRGRNLVVFSPNLTRHDVRVYFPPHTSAFQSWDDALQRLVDRHGDKARVAVVESATMQLLKSAP